MHPHNTFRRTAHFILRFTPAFSKTLVPAWLAFVLIGALFTVPTAAFTVTDPALQPPQFTQPYTAASGTYVGMHEQLPHEFTLHSRVYVGDNFFSAGGQRLVLAGASSEPLGEPDVLRLVWEQSGSGWVVLWKLRLETGAGASLVDSKTGQPVTELDLIDGAPQAGNTYDTYVSVDKQHGVAHVLVQNAVTQADVYRGTIQIKADDESVYAQAGYTALGSSPSNVADVTVLQLSPRFLPVGTTWFAGRTTEHGTLQAARRVETTDDVYIQATVLHPQPVGQFHLSLQRGEETIPLAVAATADLQKGIPIDVTRLPLGRATLRLEYVIDGHIALAEEFPLTIGSATVVLQTAETDRHAQLLQGSFRIESTAVGHRLPLHITAHVQEMVWDPVKRDYTRRPVSETVVMSESIVLDGTPNVTVPFALVLPDQPAMYELTLTADSELQLALEVLGDGTLFTTYKPATPEPGEPYIIALLPDTQNYAAAYPTIFIRQLQWVAEQASERNILLALHLGDITNDNTTIQWERAVQSITLLDGVMPYVLSQGNHDMTPTGGGNPYDRHHTRINEFFPVGKQPWIIDTFEPGQIENSYATFNLNGDDYLVIALEFGPRDEALAWASDVAAQYPNHKGIMITHVYTTRSGRRSDSALGYDIAGNPDTTVNNGDAMWHKFVSHHPNMMFAFSGHHNSENGISRQVAWGRHGNPVYEMMINYQFDTRGGNGHMALMTVQPDGLIEVRTYSPYLDIHRTETSIFGFNNHFFIDTAAQRYITVGAP